MYGPHPFPHGPGDRPGYFLAFLITRLVLFALFLLIPWIIGLTYVRRDATRQGQPGWLWALATIFLGWLAILTYLIVRAFSVRPIADTPAPTPNLPPPNVE